MRKNFTAEQMLHTVRQAESGTPVAEVCRKLLSDVRPIGKAAKDGAFNRSLITFDKIKTR